LREHRIWVLCKQSGKLRSNKRRLSKKIS